MDECNRIELWKELRQMVNKVLEDVKVLYESHNAVLEEVKALAESNKAMNEELSRLQESLKNITKEELQSLNSMELEEQIKFQESTAVVASWDVDFCVKVDDDIHVHIALEVQSKEPTKKVMMIFQEPTNEHCKYANARIEFAEKEMDNLSRGLSVGSFNFGIGSIGSKHMDVAPTKIFPIDSSYIPQAKKVELRASPTN